MPEVWAGGVRMIKTLSSRDYVYVKHGREWHYVGPLNNVDLASLFTAHTTALPLKSRGQGLGMSRPNSTATLIAGIALTVLGALLAIAGAFLLTVMGFYAVTSFEVRGGGSMLSELSNTSVAYIANYQNTTMEVSVTGSAPFQVLVVPVDLLKELSPSASLTPGPVGLGIFNATKPLNMTGNYTSFSTSLAPSQALLVRPLSKAEVSILYNLAGQQVKRSAPGLLIALFAAPLVLGVSLIAGGVYLLHKSCS